MSEVHIEVVAEQVKNLSKTITDGFNDLKELLKENALNLKEHGNKDEKNMEVLHQTIDKLKLDVNSFKVKWTLMMGIIGLVIEVLFHNIDASALDFLVK